MEILLFSALTIGVMHAMAPDHWLPFAALGKTQQWNRRRTTRIVTLAGLGHVGSGVLIAGMGAAAGTALEHVNGWETVRGHYSSLLLVAFGLLYAAWGVYRWKDHTHAHIEQHPHDHLKSKAAAVSSWTLVALIVFGPCEPLVPLLIASIPFGWMAVSAVFLMFGAATIAMMLLQVHLALTGLSMMRFHFLSDASHIVAGLMIAVTGLVIRLFGL